MRSCCKACTALPVSPHRSSVLRRYRYPVISKGPDRFTPEKGIILGFAFWCSCQMRTSGVPPPPGYLTSTLNHCPVGRAVPLAPVEVISAAEMSYREKLV